MGQKVNPIGLRLGINKTWTSRWCANSRNYATLLHEDLEIKRILRTLPEAKNADIAEIEIIRHPQKVTVVVHTARPGVIIGVKGANIEKISEILQKRFNKKIQIKIREVKRSELNASLVAQNVARQLEGRGAFRKILKQTVSNAMRSGAEGIKVRVSGRLGGADMSRIEEVKDGRIPLHTLRADIDYGFYEADTTYGKIGVKVWIYSGMKFQNEEKDDAGILLKKQRRPRSERSSQARRQ
ncbi:MAG: 30S ribosomal protein S3 [Treponema sp.]|nr:MAG: 30S ribosomal protein S3 [Treponema sp.]